jgi:hypothetical protein
MSEDQENITVPQAFEVLGQFLEDDGWYPEQIEDQEIYRIAFSGDNGEYECYAQIQSDLEQFFFYAVAPEAVPESLRAAAAEFLCRANYGLHIGNFELDWSDGEVRYKSSLDFEGEILTANWIKHAIYPAVETMDQYWPGLEDVIQGGIVPEEAIAQIEGA